MQGDHEAIAREAERERRRKRRDKDLARFSELLLGVEGDGSVAETGDANSTASGRVPTGSGVQDGVGVYLGNVD